MALIPSIQPGFSTRLLHPKEAPSTDHGIQPAVQSSVTYSYDDAAELVDIFQGRKSGYRYSRQGSPTPAVLEGRITQLEKGVGSLTFATGMAAIAAIFQTFLSKGDHVIASQFLFGNTINQFQILQRLGIEVSFVDTTDSTKVEAAWQKNTRFVFAESIANPTTQVADIQGIAALCDHHNALFILDSTFSPPAYFAAGEHGVGLVMHSLSKHFAGHGAVLGGSLTDSGAFDWQRWAGRFPEKIRALPKQQWGVQLLRNRALRDCGATLSAIAAERIMLGMETMGLRLARIQDNACTLAGFLAQHKAIVQVNHPSLEQHPQHQRARDLLKTYGGVLSFELAAGIDPIAFLNRLTIPHHATHLGDNHTLVIAVAQTIYHEMGREGRARMGIAENLIRVSLGIEDSADLVADFGQALAGL
jgi:O-acetylhomoserine (thiol)-lyase